MLSNTCLTEMFLHVRKKTCFLLLSIKWAGRDPYSAVTLGSLLSAPLKSSSNPLLCHCSRAAAEQLAAL